MNANIATPLLQVDRSDLTAEAVSKRCRDLSAKRVMVQTAEGGLTVLDVPQSNRHDKFQRTLAELGTPERVVWLDDGNNKLSELACIAAAAESHAQANTNISLLAVKQLGDLVTGLAAVQLKNYSSIVEASLKGNQENAATLRAMLHSHEAELRISRAELRQERQKLEKLKDEYLGLQLQISQLSQKPEGQERSDALKSAFNRFAEKCGELFMLAVGEHVEMPDGDSE